MPDTPLTISLPHGLSLGGVSTWALRTAEGLSRRGRRVRLVEHAGDGSRLSGVDGRSIEIVSAPPLDARHWRDNLALYRGLTPTILSPNLVAESYAIAAALAGAMPEALRVVAWNHSDNPYEAAVLRYYEPIIHAFAAVSRTCLANLGESLLHRRADLTHLPYGIPAIGNHPRQPLDHRAIRLLYLGRLDQANKRVLDLLQAAEILSQRKTAFELRFVGDGPVAAELRARAAQMERNPQAMVEVLPACDAREVPKHLRWADALLLASEFEGLSIAMLEAMKAGCAPVVSRVRSGVNDVIIEGESGLTFAVGDTLGLVRCVQRLAHEPGLIERIGRNASLAADELSDFERHLDALERMLDAAQNAEPRVWPTERPIDWRGGGGHDPTVPPDAALRMRTALHRLAERGLGPTAIYGAGGHTRSLASVLAESPCPILCVIEDPSEQHGRRLWGWEIVSLGEALRRGARSVLISSFLHEAAMRKRAAERCATAGVALVGLHACGAGVIAGDFDTGRRPASFTPSA